ncbi:MAG TPA: pantoate--beta-alanine ligase [Bacteroidales bacterium]|nr:pantoate--beta-alanine ligase [Bacteroidales bacterium]HPR72201.1 pantoate--beta-alanine ligase [Bacteroidales bacterium]
MKVVTTVKELHRELGKVIFHPVGLVPTMGALHEGHLSLVMNAIKECETVIVSIYVNPEQFNDKEDLKNYPRNTEKDLGMLQGVLRENDLVFMPPDKEIYPEKDTRIFNFGNLDNVMEALHRPGHFNGVAKVVSRLFELTNPDISYFGIKDFQQVAVVKALVKQCGFNIRISANPVVREANGLAMSSRNQLLEPLIRDQAPVIYQTLRKVSSMMKEKDIPDIKNFVRNNIENHKDFEIEYFEIVDDVELIPVSRRKEIKTDRRYYGCIAVKAGKIRLIDNIEIGLPGIKKDN